MAMKFDGMNGTAMESSESRKRPLDTESENGVTKRSNQGAANGREYTDMTEISSQQGTAMSEPGADNVHLKILVPSISAGAIIGKGGETIAQIQKETGARVKMSKANDFYPGTTERVCLIMGSADAIRKVHSFIMDKIREKPDPNPKADGSKSNFDRHRQLAVINVKILIPNSTAGMIIGKGGNYIKQIKEESGAYVQISQKSKEANLPERCITVAGELENTEKAVDMILQKIVEDPQSGSCPNISYADYNGPVASANPTGSPFANTNYMQNQTQDMSGGNNSNFGGSTTFGYGFNQNAFGGNMSGSGIANLSNLLNGGNVTPATIDNLRITLRQSGYSNLATDEISSAVNTLANYGILGMGGQQGNMSTASPSTPSQNAQQGYMMNSPASSTGMFGAVGSGSLGGFGNSWSAGNSKQFASSSPSMQRDRYGGGQMSNESQQNYSGSQSGFSGQHGGSEMSPGIKINQNSFGLGTGMPSPSEDNSAKEDLEVHDNLVGAILGPGGKGIVELQQYTQTTIQISKKGVYTPGTRNRIVTITGSPSNVTKAQYHIQQRIQQEEQKRARQAQTSAC